jgi:uncharacterized membrane protein (UPF0127 family)
MKKIINTLAILIFCIATYTYYKINLRPQPKSTKLSKIQIAKTKEQLSKGLMFKKELCEKCGMIFELPSPTKASFWMKNTYIPLDIVMIREDGYIDTVHINTTPLNEEKFYLSNNDVKYILEVNSGYTKQNNIKEGDTLDISEILDNTSKFEDN